MVGERGVMGWEQDGRERVRRVERRRDRGRVHMIHKCKVIGIVLATVPKEGKESDVRTYVCTHSIHTVWGIATL